MKDIRTTKVILEIGLFQFPLKVYSAHKEHNSSFHWYHKNCGARIAMVKKCPTHGLIDHSDIETGYQITKEQHIILDPKTLSNNENNKIVTEKFVPSISLSEDTYQKLSYVQPGDNASTQYLLLAKTLTDLNLILLGKYYFRGNENLIAIKARNNQLIMWQLYYPDEIQPQIPVEPKEMDKAYVQQAVLLIKKFVLKTPFARFFESIKDNTEERIQKYIEEHSTIPTPQPITGTVEKVQDLMEQLRKAVVDAKSD